MLVGSFETLQIECESINEQVQIKKCGESLEEKRNGLKQIATNYVATLHK